MGEFNELLETLSIISAGEQLQRIEASSFQNYKEEDRRRIFNGYSNLATSINKKKITTMEEAVRILTNGK